MVGLETPAKRKRIAKPQEERLDDLLNAAAQIFSRDGVADAKVEDITDKAGVSKGTFYLYFTSKDHAADVLWQRYIDEFLSIGEAILASDAKSHVDKIVEIFERLSEYVLDNADLHRAVFRATHSEERRAVMHKFVTAISTEVHRGVAAGELSVREPELLVGILYNGIGASLHDAISSSQPLRPRVLIRTAGDLARLTFCGEGRERASRGKRSSRQISRLARRSLR